MGEWSQKERLGSSQCSSVGQMSPSVGTSCLSSIGDDDQSDTVWPDESLVRSEILLRTKLLHEAITQRNWQAYSELCSPSVTSFRPENAGSIVVGLEFSEFYFDDDVVPETQVQHSMISPQITAININSALITYNLLSQYRSRLGMRTELSNETKIWSRMPPSNWRCIHIHSSIVRDWNHHLNSQFEGIDFRSTGIQKTKLKRPSVRLRQSNQSDCTENDHHHYHQSDSDGTQDYATAVTIATTSDETNEDKTKERSNQEL